MSPDVSEMKRFIPIVFLVLAFAVWLVGIHTLARAYYRRHNLPWFGIFRANGLRFRYLNWKERLVWLTTMLAVLGLMFLGSFLAQPAR